MEKKKSRTIITIVFMCLTMVVLASFDGILGVFLPAVKSEFNVNDSQMAIIFSSDLIAFILFTFLGGKICDKIGHRKAFAIGFIIIVLAGVLMQFVNSYFVLMAVSFLMNCGLSIATIATNSSTPIMFITSQALFMNMFHLFNSAGGALTKKIAGILVSSNINWRFFYLAIATLTLILFFVIGLTILPKAQKHNSESSVKLKDLFKSKIFILYVFIVGSYLAAIGSTFTWLVNYIHFSFNIDVNKSSSFLSLFMLISAIGMLLFMPFIRRLGEMRTVVFSSAIATVLYFIGVALGANGLYIIVLAGLFVSVIYPTTIVLISRAFPVNSSYVLGIIVTLGSAINMLFGLLLGNLNDIVGVRYAYFIVPLALMFFSLLSYLVMKLSNKNTN